MSPLDREDPDPMELDAMEPNRTDDVQEVVSE